jgi:hypothetical protein
MTGWVRPPTRRARNFVDHTDQANSAAVYPRLTTKNRPKTLLLKIIMCCALVVAENGNIYNTV